MSNHTTSAYWNNYYNRGTNRAIPSQFAAFVLSEFNDRTHYLDCGCGNGRDTFFFAEHGKHAIGVDASDVAIELNNQAAGNASDLNLRFQQLDFGQPDQLDAFARSYQPPSADSVVYARFFLHAINETLEDNFFTFASKIIGEQGVLCVEYRTVKDQQLTKVTESHYRRFIEPNTMIEKLSFLGLHAQYSVEGFGYAKYRADDAYVARMVIVAK